MMTLAFAWFIADFLSGLGHWLQDKFLNGAYRPGLLKDIKEANDLHHFHPGHITRFSLFENARESMIIAWPIAGLLALVHAPLVLTLSFFFLGFANVVHRWAHEYPGQVPPGVKGLQSVGIFQSRTHHWAHHHKDGVTLLKSEASIRYCVMTDWLNPALDYFRFFERLEGAVNWVRRK